MGKTVNMIGLRSFSSTVWGNVAENDVFPVDEGYVAELEKHGMARRAVPLKGAATKPQLRDDGPTVAEFVEAGYKAEHYPPQGYASRSTPEEIAEAVEKQKAIEALNAAAAAGSKKGK